MLLVRMKLRAPAEGLAVHPIVEVPAVSGAVAEAEETLLEAPTSHGGKHTVSILSFLGNDIDDRVDRVRSPDGPARPANHLDSLHILQQRVLDLPVHSGKQRGVHAASVNEHKDGPG